jgi:protoheme IX farnesyltransferase
VREGEGGLRAADQNVTRSWQTLAAAYRALTKPGLTGMSAGTAVAGGILAAEGWQDAGTIVALTAGTLLVGGGAIALNQYAERSLDALMKRTRRRPLSTGAISPTHALLFGLFLVLCGLGLLAVFTTTLASTLAGITVATYLLLYTPLKRKTHLATAVGGIPGAIPPLIGWVALKGSITIEAYILFLVLFLWQMPHSLALGWLFREDYQRARYRLLPAYDATGAITSRIILLFVLSLLPASVLPFALGMSGPLYLAGILAAGIAFLIPAMIFLREVSNKNARRVFVVSLLYVPLFFVFLGLDRILGAQ